MKASKFLSTLIVAGGVAFSAAVGASAFAQPGSGEKGKAPAAAQPEKKEQPKGSKGVKVGDAAPSFSLMDTDGKNIKSEDFKGKVLVIAWFNPDCPVVVGVQKKGTFSSLQEQYGSKASFVFINSSAKGKEGSGKERNAKAKSEWKIQSPILLDESGEVGHAYGATNTPQYFVVGTDGKIAYMGAIDDKGEKNYVKMALDAVLAGKAPDPSSTKPYGCSVKY